MQRLGVGLGSSLGVGGRVGSAMFGSPSTSLGSLVGLAVGEIGLAVGEIGLAVGIRDGEEVGGAVATGIAVGNRVGEGVGRAVATSLGFFGVEKSSSL